MAALTIDAMLHGLRHTYVSQLIAAGLDVLTISRRIGHASPTITLAVYGHLFSNTDARAAEIMQATFTKVRTEEGSMENLAGASRERPSVKVLAQQALLLLATCFASPTAAADDSANYFLEPCRAATTDNAPLSGTTFLQGVCMGQVVGIAYTAYALPAKLRSCWPKGTTHGQAVRVVVAYLDARPARLHENFLDLTVEALHAAWPCPARKRQR